MGCALYLMMNSQAEYIYVGISLNCMRRFAQHAGQKDWFSEVSDIQIEWFDTKAEALKAESEAIRTFNPRYNKSSGIKDGYRSGKYSLCRAQAMRSLNALLSNAKVGKKLPPSIPIEKTHDEIIDSLIASHGSIVDASKYLWDSVNRQIGDFSPFPYHESKI